eukprot:1121068-Alexandrium_andersonii.AAC.1
MEFSTERRWRSTSDTRAIFLQALEWSRSQLATVYKQVRMQHDCTTQQGRTEWSAAGSNAGAC